MNETTKKAILTVIIIIAVIVAAIEGKSALSDPELIRGAEMGHGTPGHGMKAAERAEEEKAAAAMKAGKTPPSKEDGGDVAESPKPGEK